MNKDNVYLRTAKIVSELSDFPRTKIGAVLVDGHCIIGSGYNMCKTTSVQWREDAKCFGDYGEKGFGKCHAEVKCLLPLMRRGVDLSGATMYTYRETADGNRAMARPCKRCMEVIKRAGIKRVVYTTGDGIAREKIM